LLDTWEMSVRNRIKEFIDERGITVYRFRADCDIAQKTAYDLVNNPNQLPGSNVLSKICDTYKVQPNEILVWEESQRKEVDQSGIKKQTISPVPHREIPR
jgi:DNA-binding Xre family transcriptional regulator